MNKGIVHYDYGFRIPDYKKTMDIAGVNLFKSGFIELNIRCPRRILEHKDLRLADVTLFEVVKEGHLELLDHIRLLNLVQLLLTQKKHFVLFDAILDTVLYIRELLHRELVIERKRTQVRKKRLVSGDLSGLFHDVVHVLLVTRKHDLFEFKAKFAIGVSVGEVGQTQEFEQVGLHVDPIQQN